MKQKRIIIVLFLCITLAAVCARTAIYEGKTHSLHVIFSDKAEQGDPIFLQMSFTLQQELDVQASMNIMRQDDLKSIGKTDLYTLKKTESSITLFGGYPLSTYIQEGSYIIRIEYVIQNEKKMKFDLPFIILEKQFVKETLALDETNTGIKTNTSEERMNQIRILNALLSRKDISSLYADNNFMVPTDITRRTSFFGDRRIYTYTNGKSETSLHYGIDFGTPLNTPVSACAAGKVVMCEFRISTGWTVVIEHLPGLYSLYYHLNKITVETGTIIKTGEIIAYSGNTGLSTGPHLHWEMRLLGEAVSPDFFITSFKKFLAD